jgi:hypothetical protein
MINQPYIDKRDSVKTTEVKLISGGFLEGEILNPIKASCFDS